MSTTLVELKRALELIEIIQLGDFQCEGGSLIVCLDWVEMRQRIKNAIEIEEFRI